MAALDVTKVRSQMKGLFAGFTSGQKAMLAVAGVGVVVGLWFMTRAGSPTMAPLFSNLSSEDASGITTKLESQGVAYELADGGRSVMVPEGQVYQLRLDMAADGLPTGGAAGYSLLDKQGLTTSQFRQQVDYQRAMEGELSRTIGAIRGVKAATVHLVMADDDVFASDDKKASASVLVDTGTTTLDAMSVQTIANLVASSVEGLSTTAVTVADGQGNLLLAPGQDGADAAAGTAQARQTAAFEDAMAQQLTALISPVVGNGHASIKVSADLDYDKREQTSTRYENAAPEGEAQLVISGSESQETYAGPGSGTGGVLGVDGTPATTDATGGSDTTTTGATSDGTSYNKSDANRQYAVNSVVEGVRTAPGAIRRLSVAALVDEGTVDEASLLKIQEVLSKGAGIDETRGDVLSVQSMAFDTSAAEAAQAELQAAAAANAKGATMDLVRTVGVIVIVVLVLLLAWRSMRKAARRGAAAAEPVDLRELELVRDHLQALAPLEGGVLALDHSGMTSLEPTSVLTPVALPATAQVAQELEAEIGDLIDRQPEEVASLLRNWLAERRVRAR